MAGTGRDQFARTEFVRDGGDGGDGAGLGGGGVLRYKYPSQSSLGQSFSELQITNMKVSSEFLLYTLLIYHELYFQIRIVKRTFLNSDKRKETILFDKHSFQNFDITKSFYKLSF